MSRNSQGVSFLYNRFSAIQKPGLLYLCRISRPIPWFLRQTPRYKLLPSKQMLPAPPFPNSTKARRSPTKTGQRLRLYPFFPERFSRNPYPCHYSFLVYSNKIPQTAIADYESDSRG